MVIWWVLLTVFWSLYFGFSTVAERAQHAANRKQLHQFDNTSAANTHNTTKEPKETHLKYNSLVGCVVSICSTGCQTDEDVFQICWRSFYLQGLYYYYFFAVAVRWALSATIVFTFFALYSPSSVEQVSGIVDLLGNTSEGNNRLCNLSCCCVVCTNEVLYMP